MERAELENFLRTTGVAEAHGGLVFLCDPHWTAIQRAEFERLIRTERADANSMVADGWLAVATGGTGGRLRFARHDEATLTAAVRGFCAHFSVAKVNAVGVLPMHHVSGLMAAVRCAATGGDYLPWTWKQLEAGDTPVLGEGDWFLSLVPTQLQRLLGSQRSCDWLRRFRTIFIGGGPGWLELQQQAAEARLPVAFSYGMTETAAMVAAQTATDFAHGERNSGRALPHARIEVIDEGSGDVLPAGETGVIRITSGSMYRGYFGGARVGQSFVTEDYGRLDETGALQVLGRRDEVIITGGRKVHPREVEAELRATGAFSDVVVMGLPDKEWGEAVIAWYPAASAVDFSSLRLDALAPYQRPKRYIAVADWPRNAQGKINRAALKASLSTLAHPAG